MSVMNYSQSTIRDINRRLIYDRLRKVSNPFSRTPLKADNKEFEQLTANLVNFNAVLKNGPTSIQFPASLERDKAPFQGTFLTATPHNGQTGSKTGQEPTKPKSGSRTHPAKASATTTLWNMDICSMLGTSDEIQPEHVSPKPKMGTERAPPPKKAVHSRTETKCVKTDYCPIKVEAARGERFGGYESLVSRLKNRGRGEFINGGPACVPVCRRVEKVNFYGDLAEKRLNSPAYREFYSEAVGSLRDCPMEEGTTCVFEFGGLVPPHEEGVVCGECRRLRGGETGGGALPGDAVPCPAERGGSVCATVGHVE
ncbi:uncharacterized protein LOC115228850 [Octopus sinensis]|uniref:Uncharacterized protein LOC115228850 n=1 Tax=Octopus sinensis TaxID=2607531 RepID=A0A6P7TTV3_9MOLL|nr:uncharacterized protein LOC115228850 [Octopus sinensis]